MPHTYSKRLTDLVLRMLSFESEHRPTVSEILQQRFVRDRIKIFLARQRPHSGKSSRKSSSRPSSGKSPVSQAPALSQLHENAPPAPKTEEKPAETEFNTMEPQIGTVVFQNESEPVRQAKPPSEKAKNAQMNQFISDVALNYAMQNPNLAENKETYIVAKNVGVAPPSHPVVQNVKNERVPNSNNSSLNSTSTARDRRRKARLEQIAKERRVSLAKEQSSMVDLMTSTLNQLPEELKSPRLPEPSLLAADRTLNSDYRSANRMVTLHKMLERELGISNLVKALKAVSNPNKEEMWNQLNNLLPTWNRDIWAARVYTLHVLRGLGDHAY
ncbi:Oidioi.mRNA.OKI2018_I69.XSR.g16451.t1.cds [Oikopleura dioica]|uniref:Oidioi.mRNA.OKI2018_I69.XSR.g16451.t1.cds n=1 Tax=Oikopleura dioica TaxID=34765 RepID=A0ABN7SG56_OIKDI|nr:Oidioi.mRNA.OKI2018_I69.XSR.g16451.t1.cds [Oikopleura dioica]